MILLDLILGIVGNLISDELRPVLAQGKYRKHLSKRLRALDACVTRTYGGDGSALLLQATECISDARLPQNVYVESGLDPSMALERLKNAACYQGLVRSMVTCEKTRFDDLCAQVLSFICDELPYLPDIHAEIAAETLRDTKDMKKSLGVVMHELRSAPSEAERDRSDRTARDFTAHIRELMNQLEHRKALEVVDQLKEWLPRHETYVQPSLLSELYEQVAAAEITRAKTRARHAGKIDVAEAMLFLKKAKTVQLDESGQIGDRLVSLDAYVISLEEGADAGLRLLKDRGEPDSIRRKLLILRDAGRIQEAADLIRDKVPNERWCDQAVFALANIGDTQKAQDIIEWTESLDPVIRQRCLLTYAEGLYTRFLRRLSATAAVLPGSLTPQESADLQAVMQALQPIIGVVVAHTKIQSELEYIGISVALRVSYLLGNQAESIKLAKYVSAYRPGAYELGELAWRRWMEAPPDLPQRLRQEYPDSLKVGVMAAMIEGELLGRHADAFDAAMQLVGKASSGEERKELAALLHQLAQHLGTDELSKVKQIAPSLVQDDGGFLQLLEADGLLRSGETEAAGIILEEIRDEEDTYWLQIYSNYLLQQGNGGAATDYLVKATRMLPDPDLLRKTAEVAYRSDRIDDALESLKRLLLLDPGDVVARGRLAFFHLEKNDYAAAAEQLAILSDREPSELWHGANQAVSLMHCGDAGAALGTYNQVCEAPDAPVQAFIGRAQALKSLGKVREDFHSLNSVKDRFRDDPGFLIQLQDAAFAAQQESVGHEAFMHLRQLQEEGRAEADVLRAMSVDEFVEDATAWRKQDDENHEKVIRGQMPWMHVSATNGGTASAIRRLLRGKHKQKLAQDSRLWRKQFEAIRPLLPAWVAAKARAVTASLHIR